MGKYSEVTKGLELAPPTDQKKWQKIIQRRQELTKELGKDGKPPTPHDIGLLYDTLRLQEEELKEAMSINDTDQQALERMLIDWMEDNGVNSVRLSNGVSLFLQDSVYPGMENQAEFYKWVKDTNQESLFTVNWQTMKSTVSNMLVEGKPVPPGIKAYKKAGINRRKASDK